MTTRKTGKSTPEVIEQRIQSVFELLIAGARRRDIMRHASENGWNVSERQVQNYIQRATEQLRAHAEVKRDVELGRAIRRLHKLWQDTHAAGDYRTSLQVQRELTHLLGLAEAQRIELSGRGGGPIAIDLPDGAGDAAVAFIQQLGREADA